MPHMDDNISIFSEITSIFSNITFDKICDYHLFKTIIEINQFHNIFFKIIIYAHYEHNFKSFIK